MKINETKEEKTKQNKEIRTEIDYIWDYSSRHSIALFLSISASIIFLFKAYSSWTIWQTEYRLYLSDSIHFSLPECYDLIWIILSIISVFITVILLWNRLNSKVNQSEYEKLVKRIIKLEKR